MFYEIKIALRTVRKEGVASLCKKLGVYFRDITSGIIFFCQRLPRNGSTEQLVDFSFNAAGKFLQLTQVRSEILQLAALLEQHRPRTVVEIGTAHGGTLFLWCALAHPEATIVSIDLPGGIHGGGYPYWKTWIYRRFSTASQKLHLLRGDSQAPEMMEKLKTVLPDGKVDFLFIDGNHTYDGVKVDFQNYSPLVAKGGIVVFHDICTIPPEINCQVDEFWKEIKNNYRNVEFIENPDQGKCGIGVIFL
jgi:cephalosporin hydroxylase